MLSADTPRHQVFLSDCLRHGWPSAVEEEDGAGRRSASDLVGLSHTAFRGNLVTALRTTQSASCVSTVASVPAYYFLPGWKDKGGGHLVWGVG